MSVLARENERKSGGVHRLLLIMFMACVCVCVRVCNEEVETE